MFVTIHDGPIGRRVAEPELFGVRRLIRPMMLLGRLRATALRRPRLAPIVNATSRMIAQAPQLPAEDAARTSAIKFLASIIKRCAAKCGYRA
jgi:hypothetical protein